MSVLRAPVTRALVGINVAVYIFVSLLLNNFMVLATPQAQVFLSKWGLVPAEFWHGAVWQPITSMFLHGGLIHIAVNMIALYSLGAPIEHKIGSFRFSMLYLVSGLCGALFVVAFQATSTLPTVGASGAILGLLGALAIFFPRAQLLVFFFPMKARTAAILFGLVSIGLALFDILPGISHFGHLGGLIGGVLFTWFALDPQGMEDRVGGFGSGRGGFSMGGGPRTGTSHTTGPEAQILDMMQEIMRQRAGAGPAQSPERPVKEINPVTDEDRYERPEHPQASDGPAHEPPHREPPAEPPPAGGRLYYDPASGRFFFR